MRLPRASVTLFLLGSLLALDAPGTALAAAGDPDGTFGDGGKVTTPFVFGQDVARDVVVQPDGKVVVVGDAYNGADSDLGVARYLADGSPDTTFSGDGRATIHFVGQDSANGVALQPDGKIVVVGRTGVGDFGVVRLNTNGSLDSSFSGDGKVGTPGLGAAQDVAVVGGKIVVVGGASPSPGDFVVARYTSTGSPDTTFSQDGIATTDFAGSDVAYGLAVQPDGRIVVAGVTSVNMNFALARYTTTGGLDSTFSNDGKVTTSL
ncbi:MAG TPA: delta-60 repeat domain-containing protein, partial [Actinomycetota bacterium]|nr:delta-60 repeat domain-containing protein [Actinomycetota bacterium]